MPLLRSKRRRGCQRGATVIEAALVSLVFFGLHFLIIDLSLAVWVRCTLQWAAQKGQRYGVTGTRNETAGLGQRCSIKKVVQRASFGIIRDEDLSKVEIHFYDKDTLDPLDDPSVAGSTAVSQGNVIEVSISDFRWAPIAPVLHGDTPLKMTARSLGVIEPLPGGTPPTWSGGSCE